MTSPPGGVRTRVFRSTASTIGMVASAAVAALLIVDAFWRGGVGQGMLLSPWMLLALWGVYALAYQPHVRTDADSIRLHNILSIVDIPWGQVAGIRLRWQLEVILKDGGVVRAFGGPSQGRPRKPRKSGDEGEADAAVLPAPILEVALIQEEWERAVERGAADGPVRRRPDVVSLVSLAVIVVWTVASLVVVSPWG
jgi:hypothetical protein